MTAQGPLRGVLLFLAGLMLASGLIRLGTGAGTAQGMPPAAEVPPVAAHCPTPPAGLMAALQEREQRLATREASLAERQASHALAETVIAARIAEMVAAENALAATVARVDGAAENDIVRLTAVYEAMKPKEAALLFEAMAAEFAAGFLARMRPEAAAAVLSGMTPQGAYTVSVLLAGRNALAPLD